MASITDPLTGLHNRRYLQERLSESKELADRYNIPFSVVKLINDKFEHENRG